MNFNIASFYTSSSSVGLVVLCPLETNFSWELGQEKAGLKSGDGILTQFAAINT